MDASKQETGKMDRPQLQSVLRHSDRIYILWQLTMPAAYYPKISYLLPNHLPVAP